MNSTASAEDLIETIPADIQNSGTIALNVLSYAGYADAQYNSKEIQLFYWFFESQKFHPTQSRNDEEIGKTPLLVWLNGGPGAPSTLGLFLENGPYRIQDGAGGKLLENPYSWNKDAHIIYWDQPIGTGYSRVKEEDTQTTFAKNEDELSEMFYLTFQDFLSKHPEYRSCPVYVAGESYGGKYVPNIALKIHTKNRAETDETKKINLKGISVGDGWIDARLQMKVYIDYAYTMGYLDTNQQLQMMSDYENFCAALDNKNYEDAYNISNNIVNNVSALGGNFNVYNIRRFSEISMKQVQAYMEMPAVKEKLHVPEAQKWNCADNKGPVADNLIEDNMEDSAPVYSEFIGNENLYKILMYTGTFDTACGSLSTELILYELNKWNNPADNEAWKNLPRKIWAQPSDKVKGFIKQYKNLTQIELPNSGHQVPYYKPEISLEMIGKWMQDEPFPAYMPELKKT
ncbi:Tyrosine decarboxylase [Methanosarcina siciliae C2J]|uniref:Tyrosine decarboxylase n=1 Tax=Methanosarcina siciliae C2J TaxID=1434118 RepID=A0A0E3PP27_9EURY|nr:hypothetical protein [Methanosarcina siciliae]AKB37439.1 Tyrosine decarboxylase [Methanosarcina siciliae C2J]